MNVSKRNKKHTFEAMLSRGWGRSVVYQGKEIIVIKPPNQPKLTTNKSKEK